MRQTGRHCGLLREKVEGWVVQGVQEIREGEGRGYKGWQSQNAKSIGMYVEAGSVFSAQDDVTSSR